MNKVVLAYKETTLSGDEDQMKQDASLLKINKSIIEQHEKHEQEEMLKDNSTSDVEITNE